MQNIINRIKRNRNFLLFIYLFAYIHSVYNRLLVRQDINIYIFTPEAAIFKVLGIGLLFSVILFFLKKLESNNKFSTQLMFKAFGMSLISYLLIIHSISFITALAFDKVYQNFNPQTLIYTTISELLNGLIYGSFFISYYYYNKYKKNQEKLISYNKALAESKINQLKSQLNPHFLFNNLNILDQFIEEDKEKATAFLNEFADIYRYVLQVSDKELVPISEELDFANRYFKLIQYKYGNAYQLQIQSKANIGYIVPLALQLVIENAVQHNIGSETNPIKIKIEIDNKIIVTNNINLKISNKKTAGRGINNLKTQYEILSSEVFKIDTTLNQYSITIPIIN